MMTHTYRDVAWVANLSTAAGGSPLPVTAGLFAHYKADAITGKVDGDEVASWVDSSGNGHDATQAGAGQKPLYKTGIQNTLPGVKFDNTNDTMNTNANPGLPFTLFIVYRIGTTGNQFQFAVSSSDQDYYGVCKRDTSKYAFVDTVDYLTGPTVTDGLTVYDTVKSDSGTETYRHNGSAIGTRSGSVDPHTWIMGQNPANPGPYPFNGYIFELVLYNSALGSTDIGLVEAYLATKWGL